MTNDIASLVKQYRQGALGTADVSNPQEANEAQAQMHACYKVLRETEAGREAIITLMGDVEPSVRCWAAAHSLQWRPDCARDILKTLRDSSGPYSITAEMTLEEFDAGRLSFDY